MSETSENSILFHVADAAVWADLSPQGEYRPLTFADEGFVHCCYKQQLAGVLQRYYAGTAGLVILTISRDKLVSDSVDENLIGGKELFPHVYGGINTAAVIAQQGGLVDADGEFIPHGN